MQYMYMERSLVRVSVVGARSVVLTILEDLVSRVGGGGGTREQPLVPAILYSSSDSVNGSLVLATLQIEDLMPKGS